MLRNIERSLGKSSSFLLFFTSYDGEGFYEFPPFHPTKFMVYLYFAVYFVALIQPRGSSLVVTHHTTDFRVTQKNPVILGVVPVELSTSISGSHAAT